MIFKDINKLNIQINSLKKEGKKIIWTNGCFDILHPGHLKTFEQAKKLGDILVVGLNGDKNPYWKTKPGRPINDENFRAQMLAGLKYVDYIYIFNDRTPAKAVDILKPNFVLKGGDYYIKGITEDFFRGLSDDIIKKIEKFNNIVEKELVKKQDGIIEVTNIYKYFLENNLLDIVKNIPGFMEEGYVNVKNGGKVILVPVATGYSTTNIVNKILKTYC